MSYTPATNTDKSKCYVAGKMLVGASLLFFCSSMVTFVAGAQESPPAPPPAPTRLPPSEPARPARPVGESDRLDALRNLRQRAQNDPSEKARQPVTPATDTRSAFNKSDRRGGTTTGESLRERINERREVHRVEKEARRDERQETLRDAARARVRSFMERMLGRFDAAVGRLRNLADRTGSRIEKFETRERSLSQAKELLATARVKIDAASEALAAIRTNLENAVAGDNPRAAFEAIHEALGEAKDTVRTAHRALVEAIRAIRASTGRGMGGGATTTTDSEQ